MDKLIFFLKARNETPNFVSLRKNNIFSLYSCRLGDNTVREKYFCKYSFSLNQDIISKPRNDVRAYQFNNQSNSDNIIERLNKCNTLGEKIKELRLYHNISAREMYTYLKIHKSTLKDYENDNIKIPNDILKRICVKCNEPKYLLFDEYRLFLEDYSNSILQFCKSANISQNKLSNLLSVSKQKVSYWVNKKSKPTYKDWLALCKIMESMK